MSSIKEKLYRKSKYRWTISFEISKEITEELTVMRKVGINFIRKNIKFNFYDIAKETSELVSLLFDSSSLNLIVPYFIEKYDFMIVK